MNDIPEYASVILVTPDNQLILQLRDDKPDIVDPNMLSLFASRMQPGEDPEAAARRAALEETTVKVTKLEPFMTYYTNMERFCRVSRSHAFIARNIDPATINVKQGQGYRLVKNQDQLDSQAVALISKDILHAYFDTR